ncbi:RNA polymerase sigma factor [Candidatus Kaiserbacteria bacterium]|nr:RNA polymerase sigma factor [Candidatus Kaiserbacteria bacterium]
METKEEKAFLEAFEKYADALFRHAFFRLSDRERAYDLAQDTYLKTWDYLRKGGGVENYKSFLYRTLRNLIIDEYRKKHPRSLDEMLEDEFAAPSIEAKLSEGSVVEAEEELDTKALVENIRVHISGLPEHYREVLTFRFIDGFSTGEIAETMGTTENVVSVRIHRGIAKLRQLCNI